jgi:hypothetical protein
MPSTTAAGTRIAISAGLPATQTKAGYEALTFTTVTGVESIPAFGASTTVNTFQPLDGPQEKHKGPTNYGSIQVPMALDPKDAGQLLVRAAAAPSQNANYSYRVTYPDGGVRYFLGRAFGLQETPGSATNVLMQTTTVEINTPVVIVDPA